MESRREVSVVDFHSLGIGSHHQVRFYEYLPIGVNKLDHSLNALSLDDAGLERAYVQGSLHCSELPGMLVCNHLVKILDKALADGRILKPITIAPYANPIGMHQIFLGKHLGRFSFSTGVNFNRNWPDLVDEVIKGVSERLVPGDDEMNVKLVRQALYSAACNWKTNDVEKYLKRELYKRACVSSVVLDLHCDMDAVLHMYTHDQLWPAMQDLADSLQSQCNMLSSCSGGNAFDESYSETWNQLQIRLAAQGHPAATGANRIPLACQSATVELRGQSDVYDELASQDALHINHFFIRRGFIAPKVDHPLPPLPPPSDAYVVPLTGVDFIEATVPGILAWKVKPGVFVEAGTLLGEIVNIDNVDAPRLPLVARNSGFVFGMESHKLAIPGEIVIYIAGREPLEWRKGYLLTAK